MIVPEEDKCYWIRYYYMQSGFRKGEPVEPIKIDCLEIARFQGDGWYLIGTDMLFGDWENGFDTVEVLEEIKEPKRAEETPTP